MSLLAKLTTICQDLDLPVATVLYTESPAPGTYCVLTPLDEIFQLYSDNQPGVDVEEVRISLFTKNNYRAVAKRITTACIDADLTVTARQYVGHEDDTGYHHWTIDLANFERARPPESRHGGCDQEADLSVTGHCCSNTAGARYPHQECRRVVL